MRKKGIGVLFMLAITMVFTVVFAVNNKAEAKACNYFKRVSLKKCAVTIEPGTYNYTGQECRPEVTVNYKGTELSNGVDYVVEYKNNVDAGKATVIVKGKGDYRSKQKVNFNIHGINFATECEVIIDGITKEIKVYYQGRELSSGFYRQFYLDSKEVLYQTENAGGYFYTYNVTRTYTITGIGPFEGTVVKKINFIDTEYRFK